MYQFHTFKHIHEINICRGQHLSHIFSELDAEIFAPEPDFCQDSNVLGVKHTQSQTEVTLAAQAADTAASTLL